ncbi:hypothetical protein [Gallaecimonas xiamenensis]|uniref:Uncharacterized protein n=1 Tax=Gallaecimonas xiamenensis 3-C-1 TaxID=745411 RepID=K2KIH3_9GAMM|nr:hypothetical protein [Gallaecimonas xiamenensis]EKE77065.1 hypothetical protein B3C1_02630 [Gallaecimonas xiamenensis 3-C-1]
MFAQLKDVFWGPSQSLDRSRFFLGVMLLLTLQLSPWFFFANQSFNFALISQAFDKESSIGFYLTNFLMSGLISGSTLLGPMVLLAGYGLLAWRTVPKPLVAPVAIALCLPGEMLLPFSSLAFEYDAAKLMLLFSPLMATALVLWLLSLVLVACTRPSLKESQPDHPYLAMATTAPASLWRQLSVFAYLKRQILAQLALGLLLGTLMAVQAYRYRPFYQPSWVELTLALLVVVTFLYLHWLAYRRLVNTGLPRWPLIVGYFGSLVVLSACILVFDIPVVKDMPWFLYGCYRVGNLLMWALLALNLVLLLKPAPQPKAA